jgi:hypothetical protein
MRRQLLIACILVVTGMTTGLLETPAFSQGAKTFDLVKWEYRVLTDDEISKLGKSKLEAGLNELGKEGWELVGIVPKVELNPKMGTLPSPATFYFKRPIAKTAVAVSPATKTVDEISIFTLKHADAAALVQVLGKLFAGEGKVVVAADPASNSIIVKAGPHDLKVIEALIGRLEDATAIKKAPPPPPVKP